MRDSLYVPDDIPSDYHYAIFNSNGSIRLFNAPYGHNNTLDYYEIQNQVSSGLYTQGSQTFSNYSTTYFSDISISRDWFDRSDFYKTDIVIVSLVLFGLFFINMFTSILRKGGALGGLF